MNREDIIRMARVAGCHDNGEEFRFVELHYLERFAALVAAAEREACASVVDANVAVCRNNSMLADVLAGNAVAIRARGIA